MKVAVSTITSMIFKITKNTWKQVQTFFLPSLSSVVCHNFEVIWKTVNRGEKIWAIFHFYPSSRLLVIWRMNTGMPANTDSSSQSLRSFFWLFYLYIMGAIPTKCLPAFWIDSQDGHPQHLQFFQHPPPGLMLFLMLIS